MTKASTSEKKSAAKSETKKTAAKKATTKSTKKATTSTRSTTKARTVAKKTSATRTATKKAASTKAATKAKPAAKKATKTTKAAAKPTKKTTTKAAPKKTATKTAAKKAATKTAKPKATKAASPKPKNEKKPLKTALKAVAAKKAAEKASTKTEKPAEDDKPKIAPAPMRPALRVAKRAEARRDKNQTFKVNTQIVYPAHGVGFITDMEKQTIADFDVELFVIDFEHEKMKLRVPVNKAAAAGMRNLSTDDQIDDAMKMLEGKARIKRTMWSRRAQEYAAKINSGDLISVAEVVRDLFRADDQPEQSYSERQLFEQARERFGREVAAVRKFSLEDAVKEIHKHLDKKERVPVAG